MLHSTQYQDMKKVSNRYSSNAQEQEYSQRKCLPITLRQVFAHRFNKVQWQQIRLLPAKIFLKQQKAIRDQLFNNKYQFQKFFVQFYQNHKHLYHWSILARQNFAEIKAYIFQQLIKKTLQDHMQYFRSLHINKKMHTFYMPSLSKSKQKNSKDKGQSTSQNQMYQAKMHKTNNITANSQQKIYKYHDDHKREMLKSIFNMALSEDEKKKFDKYSVYLSNRGQNYHQLFVKTYMACDGPKYIVYDYERHMKGLKQRNTYNQFIRTKKAATQQQSLRKSKVSKQQFKQNWPTVEEPNYGEQKKSSQHQDNLNYSFEYISLGQIKKKILKNTKNRENKSLDKQSKGLQRIIHPKTFKINKYPFAIRKMQNRHRF